MDLIGKIVKHKTFGVGEIIECTFNIIAVQFENRACQFECPTAFEKFLVFEDATLQKMVEDEIAKIRNMDVGEKLIRNLYKGYGTRAMDIYENCCRVFGWDYSKLGQFALKKPLYAYNATPEGYSVIFLAHSNWTDTKVRNRINIIQEKTLEERWREIDDDAFYTDTYTRVVFAKDKYGEYVFLGVYLYKETKTVTFLNEEKHFVKIYKRVSSQYPLIDGKL